MFKFSNPRTRAVFEDWPSGRFMTKCGFLVHTDPKKGERVSRITHDKNGKPCKPKFTTYATEWAIVDGENGKTYLLARGPHGITVMSADMQHNAPRNEVGEYYYAAGDARLPELLDLFAKRVN